VICRLVEANMPGERPASAKPRICFVAHDAYSALVDNGKGFLGGVQRQTALMARWLASNGYQVSVLAWDEGQSDEAETDGVRVFRLCGRREGIPFFRFLHPQWTRLVRAMRRADADVYYQNGAEHVTGQVAMWCRSHGRRFVFSSASDTDCDPGLPRLGSIRERVLYRYGLYRADRIITQTRHQQGMLLKGMRLESTVLPMPCQGPDETEYQSPKAPVGREGSVLWIGRIAPVKRLELLLEVAEGCSEVAFHVVGDCNAETPYARRLKDWASRLANVTLYGRVVYSEVETFYRKASLLCCTSVCEGFPNTFLEAWSHGLPTVSTFDPDGLIAARRMGTVAVDSKGLSAGIRRLLGSQAEYRAASESARSYFANQHTVRACMPAFERVFLEVAARGGVPRAAGT
jgi:glycosyltransferase involved in cell wall biosynthesis